MSDPDSADVGSLSSTITKAIAKEAQAESRRLDVLVCGRCHNVFHFVEEFTEHKSDDNCGKPAFRTSITEDKPQVWAFLLWKSTVALKEKESSWALYNRWCKLDHELRSSWTAAGQAILSCTALSVEADAAIGKMGKEQTVGALKKAAALVKSEELESEPEEDADDVDPLADVNDVPEVDGEDEEGSTKDKDVEKVDEVEEKEEEEVPVIVKRGRGRPPRGTQPQAPKSASRTLPLRTSLQGAPSRQKLVQKQVVTPTPKVTVKKEEDEDDASKSTDKSVPIKMTRAAASLLKSKPGPKKNLMGGPNQTLSGKATRSKKGEQKPGEEEEESEDEDYVVEKILAKRLNQKTKEYEYLLKWEGYPHEQNTWEPIHNMVECEKLVENFERSLAKQKASQAAGHKVITKVVKMPVKPEVKKMEPQAGPSTEVRPSRSSKMKAMENVKSWCGSMGTTSSKRKTDGDSDSEDYLPEKKIKLEVPCVPLEDGSGDENDDKKTPGLLKSLSLIKSSNVPKKSQSSITVNGLKGSPTKSPVKIAPAPPPILVANSQGIIKLDSRQVPNLSSGVYIVSNQAGIVKLTSPASSSVNQTQTGVKSGIVRKVAAPSSPVSELRAANEVKLLPKGSPSGLVRVPTPTTTIIKKRSPLAPLTGPRPLRVLGPRPATALMQQRPGPKPSQRPPFVPRPPQILRPPIRPTTPSTPRILSKSTSSPAAQVKSGVRPIQAMLGGSLGTSSNIITVNKNLITGIVSKTGQVPRGRKPGPKTSPVLVGFNGKAKESKLIENDNLHMEFQEESSSSDDDGVESLPELPTGDPPSPLGSPLPLTLCPLTGKILARAEGEPTPPPSPEPPEILPDLESTGEEEQCLKVEMSPGGTTGTVVNVSGQPFDDAAERIHDDGITVTKMISGDGGSDGEDEEMEQEYVTITGEDGVVYQMVTQGNNLVEGQVLMGEDGQQVYVTAGTDQQLTLDTAVAEAVSQLIPAGDSEESQDAGDDSTQAQVVAQIVEEGDTTPGGMRRVVLLLPDGNFMMTEVDEDQYAALDLDSSDTSPTK